MGTFLEAVKQKAFDQQLNSQSKESVEWENIAWRISLDQVDPVRWVSMTTDQRKVLAEKVMCINIKDFERTPYDKRLFQLN